MSQTEPGANGNALDSVRRLEERLNDRRGIEEDARARVTAAREDAERVVREVREGAEREAAQNRREAPARADEEAESIVAGAGKRAETLGRIAGEDRAAAAWEVVLLILPKRDA